MTRGLRQFSCVALLFLAHTAFSAISFAEDPHVNYMIHCQGCHLEDGAGAVDKVPALKGYVGNFLRVPGGREFLVQVPGSASSFVDDQGLADILNWILVNLSPEQTPTDFDRFTAEEVARLRSTPSATVTETRIHLVEQIEALDDT